MAAVAVAVVAVAVVAAAVYLLPLLLTDIPAGSVTVVVIAIVRHLYFYSWKGC